MAHTHAAHHDRLVTHVELWLSRDQGVLVLLDDQFDPAEGILVLTAGKAGDKGARVTEGAASLAVWRGGYSRAGAGGPAGKPAVELVMGWAGAEDGVRDQEAESWEGSCE